jgi:hypothetical protein
MATRARMYVCMAATVLLAFAYTRIAGDWSDVAYFAGMAALIAIVASAGNFWLEFAPDGAFRREPRA